MPFYSETMKEVTPALNFSGAYVDVTLLRETSNSRIFSAVRAGRRFLLKTTAGGGAKELLRLKREYEISLPISHPNLAYVFTYEQNSPVGPCIVMEYVAGRSLDEWLGGEPSLAQKKAVMNQLLDAVDCIHSHGIVHNDLSPQNILITEDGDRVKLIDFGFSDDGSYTIEKSLGGTRDFASPELLRGEDVDARSDIWSLGNILRLIFGCRYFFVSAKCLRADPQRRYRDIRSLRLAMKRHLYPICFLSAALVFSAILLPVYRYHSVQKSLETEIAEWFDKVAVPGIESILEDPDKASRTKRIIVFSEQYNEFMCTEFEKIPPKYKYRMFPEINDIFATRYQEEIYPAMLKAYE